MFLKLNCAFENGKVLLKIELCYQRMWNEMNVVVIKLNSGDFEYVITFAKYSNFAIL